MQAGIENLQNASRYDHCSGGFCVGSGGWIRTIDLRVMSPTSCHCSTPRWLGARTYSPSGQPASTIGAAAFHDPVRDGTGWDHSAPRTPLVQGPVPRPVRYKNGGRPEYGCIPSRHVFPQGSPRPCAPVASTPHDASSSGRLPSHLLGDLPGYTRECTHLAVHFPLRCFQRFLLPDIATEPAGRPTTPPPAVRPIRSSRTKISSAQYTNRP